MIEFPSIESLSPQQYMLSNGQTLYAFVSKATELVKLDLIFEAGTFYQPQPLCAQATNKLLTVASRKHPADYVSEFIDYRGIIIENSVDVFSSTISIYLLRKYMPEMLPLLKELLSEPGFGEDDVKTYREKKKSELLANEQRTSVVARNLFYQSLYGTHHPLGVHALSQDADRLTPECIQQFYLQQYNGGATNIILSGNVDEALVKDIDRYLTFNGSPSLRQHSLHNFKVEYKGGEYCQHIDTATQTSLRIGRVLPLAWNDMNYARFMLLSVILGGYFGSRLSRNIREEKGYTYGIYSRTQIYRGSIVFFIAADIAMGKADVAIEEILREIEQLSLEKVPDEELAMAKQVMVGDFIRSVDGVFERSTRFGDMLGSDVTEQLTINLQQAINETTAPQLQELARRLLNRDELWICRAGA